MAVHIQNEALNNRLLTLGNLKDVTLNPYSPLPLAIIMSYAILMFPVAPFQMSFITMIPLILHSFCQQTEIIKET
jgi:hypothetical protein